MVMLFRWGVVLMLISLLGCGEESSPAPQPKATSKKISVQPTPVPAPVTPGPQTEASPQAQPSAPDVKPVAAPSAETSELIQASLQIAGSYNPDGRFDPFEPLFKEQPDVQAEEPKATGKREKRKPQTPLERVALSQLKVTAIIRSPSGNRALVEDATGKGYVVKKGTYVGLNAGQVVDIDKDRIVVEEEVENVMGELRIENSELKLQKPAGEF